MPFNTQASKVRNSLPQYWRKFSASMKLRLKNASIASTGFTVGFKTVAKRNFPMVLSLPAIVFATPSTRMCSIANWLVNAESRFTVRWESD